MENTEKYTISLIKDLNVFFDVGAREDGIEFIELSPTTEFHFFEPHKAFADSLSSSIPAEAKAVVNQYGLWNEKQDNAMFYTDVQSFIPHPFLISEFKGDVYNLRTLDWYMNTKKIKKIDFLKIDAEGADFKILEGAKKTIDSDRIRHIQFEYWDGVRKFYDLLNDKYNMYFIRDVKSLSPLTEEVISEIDVERIRGGLGGDIFCVHKNESIIL